MNAAAIGFRAKTGRAIVVALSAAARYPTLIFRREISLVDPRVPATSQPFHEVMELPWPQATTAAQPSVSAIEAVATAALKDMLAELKAQRFTVRGAGIVGSRDQNLEKIGNPHIRAHAAEGILFRRVLEVAARAHRLPFTSFSDKEIAINAVPFAARLKILGKEAGSPWRTDEKNAASAALLALKS